MEKLKPCPFCGGQAGVGQLKSGKFPRYSVQCFNQYCFASASSCFGRKYSTEADAIEAWNRRAK